MNMRSLIVIALLAAMAVPARGQLLIGGEQLKKQIEAKEKAEAKQEEAGDAADGPGAVEADALPGAPTEAPEFESQLAERSRERFDRALEAAQKAYRDAMVRAARSYVRSLKVALKSAEKQSKRDEAERIREELMAVEGQLLADDATATASNDDAGARIGLFQRLAENSDDGKAEKDDEAEDEPQGAKDARELLAKIKAGRLLTPADFGALLKGKIGEALLNSSESIEAKRRYDAVHRTFNRLKVNIKFTIDDAYFRTRTYSGSYARYSGSYGEIAEGMPRVQIVYYAGYRRRLSDKHPLLQFKEGDEAALVGYIRSMSAYSYYSNKQPYLRIYIYDTPY